MSAITDNLLEFDRDAAAACGGAVAGMDEAGRGPLAGPVVAACVMLPLDEPIDGVNDSKKVYPARREKLYDAIMSKAAAVGVGRAERAEIDSVNILNATRNAMREAYAKMGAAPGLLLVDAVEGLNLPVETRPMIRGDGVSYSVAAASIVAKVTRDRLMCEHDRAWPQYGFAEHKGYPTPLHLERLAEHGPCPLHRRSFAPVLQQCLEMGPADDRRALGQSGETVAAAHLQALGWEVLASRYHCRGGEVDLVAREGETLVFVEVKARRGREAAPAAAVDARKRHRLAVAARAYLASHGGEECACRFDVAEVAFGPDGRARVNLLRGAFIAGE